MTELNEQPTLFELPDLSLESVSNLFEKSGLTCNTCEHRQRHQCNSKVFQYCGVRLSRRTHNKLLNIKFKTPACLLYEPYKP